jgi:hypothetical protein
MDRESHDFPSEDLPYTVEKLKRRGIVARLFYGAGLRKLENDYLNPKHGDVLASQRRYRRYLAGDKRIVVEASWAAWWPLILAGTTPALAGITLVGVFGWHQISPYVAEADLVISRLIGYRGIPAGGLQFISDQINFAPVVDYVVIEHDAKDDTTVQKAFHYQTKSAGFNRGECSVQYEQIVQMNGNTLFSGNVVLPLRENLSVSVLTGEQIITRELAANGRPWVVAEKVQPEVYVTYVKRGAGDNLFFFRNRAEAARMARTIDDTMRMCGVNGVPSGSAGNGPATSVSTQQESTPSRLINPSPEEPIAPSAASTTEARNPANDNSQDTEVGQDLSMKLQALLAQAEQQFDAGQYRDAAATTEAILELEPGNVSAQRMHAVSLRNLATVTAADAAEAQGGPPPPSGQVAQATPFPAPVPYSPPIAAPCVAGCYRSSRDVRHVGGR